ncbi:2'-5' RNA ligase family protein [Kitasatospora sp. NPDC058190]|uniref:2'-5' RNA ligase family protein n=1 Tax=Kitasatospora sp. NPDC058190 TaxID=3346371 RepID=UPI0036D974EA
MRQFMSESRFWGRADGPDEDWIRPHVLWLPQDQPQVLDYFARLREITSQYPDVISSIAEEDLHMTIQKINPQLADGTRVDDDALKTAAVAVQKELASLEPFTVEIGPARASGSAGIVEIWPEQGPAELYRRVRAGLTVAGLQLPPPEENFWCHMSCGYGVQDTDTPELAARSDRLASDFGRRIRPGVRTSATVSSVWLVWERQHPASARYSFERVHQLHVGQS